MDEAPAPLPFDDPTYARHYGSWYDGRGRGLAIGECTLLAMLLDRLPRVSTAVDLGCGTGHFARWLEDRGVQVICLDRAAAMLDEAARRGTRRVVLADAGALPLATASVDLAVCVTTLEFVEDTARVLAEAARVARHGLLIGAINRWSALGWRRRHTARPPWSAARLLSPPALAARVRRATAARRPAISWRTAWLDAPGLTAPWRAFRAPWREAARRAPRRAVTVLPCWLPLGSFMALAARFRCDAGATSAAALLRRRPGSNQAPSVLAEPRGGE